MSGWHFLSGWHVPAWRAWLDPAIRTVVTLGLAYLFGYILRTVVVRRLAALVARTRGVWDDIVVDELRRRIPLWSMLAGAWLALGYWKLDAHADVFASRAIFVLAALSVTLAIAGTLTRLVGAYGPALSTTVPVTGLTRNLVWIITASHGALINRSGRGGSVLPILATLGVGGLAVALALQEPLSNLFAGLFVTLAGQARIGDYVKLESGIEGYIVDFSWRVTRIRMLSNNLIIVPNAKLAQATLVNYSLPHQDLAVLVEVGVDYASDLAKVERVTSEVGREVMQQVTGGVADFEPFIRYHTFGESSVKFTVILRGKEYTDQYLVTHEFIKRLHARYLREGITIPFPVRTVIQKPS